MKCITFLLLLLTQVSFAQNKSLTKVINKIDFQGDTLQAVYDWVTQNVKYDVAKLKQLESGVDFYKKGKYKNREEYKRANLENVIRKKKGVCDDYTLLFDAILTELGYTSRIVAGITKNKRGKISKNSSHSWSAVYLDGVWKLYDPTWGSGYVKDGKKFVKNYNLEWYDVDPEVMKERHFPFDPIWQLSTHPMTYKEFEKGTIKGQSKANYDYNTLITEHEQLDDKQQLVNRLARSNEFGGNTSRIKKHRRILQKRIDNYDMVGKADLLNTTIEDCRKSSEIFSAYFKAKSQRFKGGKWTLEYAKSSLAEIEEKIAASIVTFENVEVKNSKAKRMYKKNATQSKNLLERIQKEIEYLDTL